MKSLLFVLILFPLVGLAQNNVMHSDKEFHAYEARISDVAWIHGHWKGEALGGIVEELWSLPLGGSMMGSFKLVSEGEVNFYELQTISEENGSLVFRLKHFGNQLDGWEEKEKPEDQVLIKLTDSRAYFDGITFEKVGDKGLNIYVVFEQKGQMTEAKFAYEKAD